MWRVRGENDKGDKGTRTSFPLKDANGYSEDLLTSLRKEICIEV